MSLNCSDPRSHPRAILTSMHYFTFICYSICFCIAFIGNGTMFLILIRNQRVKVRRVHTLLLHMNIAHLIVTLIYMPKEVIHSITVAWWGSDFLCRICKFFDNFGNSLAANMLICISLDRFYSIFSPLYTLNAKKSVQRMIAIAWIVSFLISIPAAALFRTSSHPCAKWFIQCVSGDFVGAVSHDVVFAYTIANLTQVSLLPLIITVICYSFILYKISSKNEAKVLRARQVNSSKLSFIGISTTKLRSSGETYTRAKSKTLKMTFVVVSAFLLCWTPYAVASLVHFTIKPSPIPAIIRKLLYTFAVFNSAISPYLYGYFSFDLKRELLLLVKCSNTDAFERVPVIVANSAVPKRRLLTQATNSFQHSCDDQRLLVSKIKEKRFTTSRRSSTTKNY
uniref:G_PROTEIN_RECEP_F1_2 domain-containing protein n=1 Tax=Wuchereria bancrofti TaxID=6293 RepID=A0A1I8EKW8_WUCBA